MNTSYESFINALEQHKVVFWDPVAASILWMPKGLHLRRSFEDFVISKFKSVGFETVELPLLIDPKKFSRQSDHAEGLLPYLYNVSTQTNQSYYLIRPTSEVPFTELFAQLSKQKVALPYQFIQAVTVFRDEKTLNCVPFLRQREISPFIETYSMTSSNMRNEAQVVKEVEVYSKIFLGLGVSTCRVLRPIEDTFPEAKYSVAFDSYNNTCGVQQVATVHHLGQSFANALGIVLDGERPFQTSTGISSRALGLALFLQWLKLKRDPALFEDARLWPWNAAHDTSEDFAESWHTTIPCCSGDRCRNTIATSNRVLGWGLDLDTTTCRVCGKQTKPLLVLNHA